MRYGRYKDVTECGVNPNHFRTVHWSVGMCVDMSLSPGGFWLQKHCDCWETNVLLRAHTWGERLGQRDILTVYTRPPLFVGNPRGRLFVCFCCVRFLVRWILRGFLNSATQLCQFQPSQSASFHLVRANQTEAQLRGRRWWRHGRHGHSAPKTERT